MITEPALKPTAENHQLQEIEPYRAYQYSHAAHVSGVSRATIIRAVEAGYLNAHRSHKNGVRTVILGLSLLKWIAAGRKTGRTSADVLAEMNS